MDLFKIKIKDNICGFCLTKTTDYKSCPCFKPIIWNVEFKNNSK